MLSSELLPFSLLTIARNVDRSGSTVVTAPLKRVRSRRFYKPTNLELLFSTGATRVGTASLRTQVSAKFAASQRLTDLSPSPVDWNGDWSGTGRELVNVRPTYLLHGEVVC